MPWQSSLRKCHHLIMEFTMFEETHSQFQAGKESATTDLHQLDETTLAFAVLFSVVVFVVFLVMFSDQFPVEMSSTMDLQIPELSMVVAKIPFQVEFPQLERASLTDGFDMTIRVEEPVEVLCYWGASCALLIHALNDNPRCLLYQDVDLDHIDYKSFMVHPEGDNIFHITPSCLEESLNFGSPPRIKYPLVIVIRCLNEHSECQDNFIVGGVWIIHLPDPSFHQPGHVVSNAVITNHGQVHNLQKMFMSADSNNVTNSRLEPNGTASTNADTVAVNDNLREGESTHSEDEFSLLDDGQHDCAVCQNGPISKVILPCRHACVCEDCFKLVTKCPICRGPVVSHFALHRGQSKRTSELDIREVSDSWMEYLKDLPSQINRRLGLT